jgi:hypothetical protein
MRIILRKKPFAVTRTTTTGWWNRMVRSQVTA